VAALDVSYRSGRDDSHTALRTIFRLRLPC
jgi:hypothetical protein